MKAAQFHQYATAQPCKGRIPRPLRAIVLTLLDPSLTTRERDQKTPYPPVGEGWGGGSPIAPQLLFTRHRSEAVGFRVPIRARSQDCFLTNYQAQRRGL